MASLLDQFHKLWITKATGRGSRKNIEPSGCDDGRPKGYMARIYEVNLHDSWCKTTTCSLKSVRVRTLISTSICASLAESSTERLRPLVM